jgi:hypothetical protein
MKRLKRREVKERFSVKCVYYRWFIVNLVCVWSIVFYIVSLLFALSFVLCYVLITRLMRLYYSFYVCFLVVYILFYILCVLCFCIVSCIYNSCFFSVCVQVYGPLLPDRKPSCSYKYYISYSKVDCTDVCDILFSSHTETCLCVMYAVILLSIISLNTLCFEDGGTSSFTLKE